MTRRTPVFDNIVSYAVPGRSSRFSNTHIALQSAFRYAGMGNSGLVTRSIYAVRWIVGLVIIRLADCLPKMRGNTCASGSAPPCSTISIALAIAYASVHGHHNHLHPTPAPDADVDAFKKGNWFRREYVPLREYGNRFLRVHSDADSDQLSLEKRHNPHSVGCNFHQTDADVIYCR